MKQIHTVPGFDYSRLAALFSTSHLFIHRNEEGTIITHPFALFQIPNEPELHPAIQSVIPMTPGNYFYDGIAAPTLREQLSDYSLYWRTAHSYEVGAPLQITHEVERAGREVAFRKLLNSGEQPVWLLKELTDSLSSSQRALQKHYRFEEVQDQHVIRASFCATPSATGGWHVIAFFAQRRPGHVDPLFNTQELTQALEEAMTPRKEKVSTDGSTCL